MLRRWRYAPLPIALLRCRGFGSVLEPRVSSAQDLSASELLRTLLMVAASEPTSWLSSNSYILPHLARHLGPWPAVWAVSLLSTGLITRALTPGCRIQPFAVWLGSVSFTLPCPTSALPSASSFPRLALKLFRGEPAISTFDWHFTPTRSSSQSFSTLTGSALHPFLPGLQPGHA